MLLQLSWFFSLCRPPSSTPNSLRQSPCHCSCPWIMCISSLAAPFPILFTSPWLFCNYLFVLINPLTSSPIPQTPSHLVIGGSSTHRACPPSAMDKNKSTKTWSAWGGKVANLSKEKGLETVPQRAFIGSNVHRNTSKAHRSLSGSNDQTIDNIQRTMRAYSKSGSVS